MVKIAPIYDRRSSKGRKFGLDKGSKGFIYIEGSVYGGGRRYTAD
jgi:hypothetical protein